MNSIERISVNDQKALLQKKLDDRTNLNLVTNSNHKNAKENQVIAFDLCKGDLKDIKAAAQAFCYWSDNFVWIEDPEGEDISDKKIPFLLWDFQEKAAEEIIDAIVNGYDLPIEKSRKLGLSWLVISIFVWGWHFHGWNLLVGSQKKENVYKAGNTKALLIKALFLCENLPEWMLPPLREKKDYADLILRHPKHGASLAGESNNTNFGRSDRRKAILFDEFASWEQTEKAAWQSCSAATKCRIPLSTPNTRGTNCHFFTITKHAHKENLPILKLHWTLHPIFSEGLYFDEAGLPRSPWYDKECKRSSPQEVAQEIDINYEASMAGKVYGGFSIEDNVVEDLEYNPNLPLYVAWDFGLDATAIIWLQPDIRTGNLNIIDEYQGHGNDGIGGDNIMHYIDIVQSKPYKAAVHYGDPQSGENRSLAAGTSNANLLRKSGIIFRSKRTRIDNRLAAARNIIDKLRVSETCSLSIEMFVSWQFIKQKTGNTSVPRPAHNEFSHLGEAFSYFAFNYGLKKQKIKRTKKRYISLSGVNI